MIAWTRSPVRKSESFPNGFENEYAEDPEAFVSFICSRAVAVRGSYEQTWDYIFRGTNSLKRGTNFGLFFDSAEQFMSKFEKIRRN